MILPRPHRYFRREAFSEAKRELQEAELHQKEQQTTLLPTANVKFVKDQEVSTVTPPSIQLQSFSCPHCGAFSHHTWYTLYAKANKDGNPPNIPKDTMLQNLPNPTIPQILVLQLTKGYKTGLIFDQMPAINDRIDMQLHNIFLSRCYSCKQYSTWVNERIVFPPHTYLIQSHEEMPPDVKKYFDEAARVVEMSPRGSAALARLCVQKLCKHLGGQGKNLNVDIRELVKNGLHPMVQKALDAVRVIGNNAVHPGIISLDDDNDTALAILRCVNMIVDRVIHQEREVSELFHNIPESSRLQIKIRDEKQ